MLTLTPAQDQKTGADEDASDSNEDPAAVVVEDRADLDAPEEDDEQVQTENPSDLRRAVPGQLVGREVGLKDSRGVDQSKDGDHGAERSEHHEPGLGAALGVLEGVDGRHIIGGEFLRCYF